MPCNFEKLEIPAVILVSPWVFPDDRGFFLEYYKKSEFYANGIEVDFVQDNHSKSTKGVVRGLHYQKDPCAQGKLVRAIQGSIFDVAVDIRKGSPTYGKWVGAELTDENHKMLYIPAGFAHGFSVLSETAQITYKVTAEYSGENDRGVLWNDPAIGIDWRVQDANLSEKDIAQPKLADADNDFAY